MFAKRSQMLKNIKQKLDNPRVNTSQTSEDILEMVELFMEPKLS